MSLAIQELKELQLKSELITIELDSLDQEIGGHVCLVNDAYIGMNLFEQNGTYEGYGVFETSSILSFWWGNREHKAMASHIDVANKIITPSLKANSFKDAVLELNEAYDSLALYKKFDGTNFDVAEIVDHDNEWLKLHRYGIRSSLSRSQAIYLWEDLRKVVVNSPYQNQIVELHSAGLD